MQGNTVTDQLDPLASWDDIAMGSGDIPGLSQDPLIDMQMLDVHQNGYVSALTI